MVKFTLKGISNLTESPAYFQQVNGIYRKDGALALAKISTNPEQQAALAHLVFETEGKLARLVESGYSVKRLAEAFPGRLTELANFVLTATNFDLTNPYALGYDFTAIAWVFRHDESYRATLESLLLTERNLSQLRSKLTADGIPDSITSITETSVEHSLVLAMPWCTETLKPEGIELATFRQQAVQCGVQLYRLTGEPLSLKALIEYYPADAFRSDEITELTASQPALQALIPTLSVLQLNLSKSMTYVLKKRLGSLQLNKLFFQCPQVLNSCLTIYRSQLALELP